MATIHPTAFVDPRAKIADDVTIGPFCVIEADVTIDAGCRLAGHVVVKEGTHLGQENIVSEGAVLGGRPQHLRAGERVGRLDIGCGNLIREYVTVHAGLHEGGLTTVGSHNLLMVNAHVAHDCRIGDHTILANNVMIAGHVTVESRAYISGAVGIHQFCRVGQLAMVGGQAHVTQDIPPFVMVDGLTSLVVGLNRVGLRRNGYSESDILQLKAAYRVIYRSGLRRAEVLSRLAAEFPSGPAAAFHEFLLGVKRGLIRDRQTPPKSTIRIFSQDRLDESGNEVREAV